VIGTTLLPTALLDSFPTLVEYPSVPVWLGYPGRCTGRARRLLFCFDDSGSMTGGNDPVGNRYAEAAHAVATVARSCTCGREWVQVLHFDAGHDAGPCHVGDPRVADALRQPMSPEGSSALGPALRRARRSARATGAGVQLVILSDFELLDRDVDKTFARLAAFPGRVTAVVLGVEPDPRLADPRITVLRIEASDAPGALARELFAQITAGRPGRALPQ
jgi:hypothetical protein